MAVLAGAIAPPIAGAGPVGAAAGRAAAPSSGAAAAAAAKPVEGGLVKRRFINAGKHAGGVSFDAQAGVFAVRLYRPDRGTWTRVVLDTSFPVRRRRVGARVAISPDGVVHVVPSDCDPARRRAGEAYALARKYAAKELGCAEAAVHVDESDAHEAGGEVIGQQVTAAIAAAVRTLAARLAPLRQLAPSADPAAVFEFAVHKA